MKLFSKRTQITTIFLILILLLAACERPFRTDTVESDPETTDGTTETTDEDTDAGNDEGVDTDADSSDSGDTDSGEETTDEGTDDADTGADAEDDASRPDTETEEGSDEDGAADDGAGTDGDTTEDDADDDEASEEGDDGDTDADTGEDDADEGEAADDDAESGDEADVDTDTADDAESGDEAEGADAADDDEAASGEDDGEASGPTTHTVVAGDNLYRIGLQYNVSWLAIAEANNIPNANAIFVGQDLTIPGAAAEVPVSPDGDGEESGEVTHVVQAGETLQTIGLQYNVNWTQIAEANGLVNPNRILIGQILKIPTDTPGPAPQFVHTVQVNETLFILALRYGVLWTDIAVANEIEAPYVIFPGQQLVIPGG